VRRLLAGLGLLVLLALAVGSGFLAWAHWSVRREGDPIPPPAVVRALEPGPVRISWIDTARQPMARSAVLAASRDPDAGALYTMSHPSFVLEWPDGRILLVDTGMTRDQAVAFGRLIEKMSSAQPMEPQTPVAEALGPALARVAGVVFTHLHEDHVGGLPSLCAHGPASIPVFLNDAQVDRPNWTTTAGLRLIDQARCAQRVRIAGDGPLRPLPGFPGVAVFHGAGHTPGSQVIFADVQGQRIALAGDIANAIDGIRWDVPKPFLYSLLVVPEATGRLHALRVWLRDLAEQQGVNVVVSHDGAALRRSGLPAWSPPAA